MADIKFWQLEVAEDGVAGGDVLPISIFDAPGSEQITAGAVAALASGGLLDPTTTDFDLIVRKVAAVAAIGVGFIGDSITAGTLVVTAPPDTFDTVAAPTGVTIAASNQGVSGATSADWVPGTGAYYAAAKTALLSAGVRLVHVMLGTNDSKTGVATTQADYRANLRALCDDLVDAGFLVAISYPPFLNTVTGVFDASSPSRILSYCAAVDSLIDNSHIFRGDTVGYAYFKKNAATALQSDGVHPTQAGSDQLATLWAQALSPIVRGLSVQTVLQRLALGAGLSIADVGGVLTLTASGSGGLNIQTVASTANITPTYSNDVVDVTALAAASQITNPTGTVSDFWGCVVRIKDSGVARALTWDTQYRAVDASVSLPNTTVAGKTLYIALLRNSPDAKIDVMSVRQVP